MNCFSPLWNSLVDSSIWEEPDHVFRLFMAMVSLKDYDYVVRTKDAYKLARRLHMDLEKVRDGLRVLSSPDGKRMDQEFEGRRIREVEDGWLILNGEKYQLMMREEMRKARVRKAQRVFRERQKQAPLPGEGAAVRAMDNGDELGADRHTTNALPEQCQ